MLRLGQQVGGDTRSRSTRSRDDDDFGRPGVPVDADIRRNVLLGRGHPGIARPRDQVDGTDRLRAVGERRDRMGPAHTPHLVHSGEIQNVPQYRTVPVSPGRRRDDDLLDAGEPGRHRGHQHGRRIREAATRHVEADPANGDATLLDPDAVPVDALDSRPAQQGAVIGLDRAPGALDRVENRRLDLVDGGSRAVTGKKQRGGRGGVVAIEAAHRLEQGGVAAGPHPIHDLGRRLADLRRNAAAAPPVEEFQTLPSGEAPRGEDAKRAATDLSHRQSPSLRASRAARSAAGGERETTPG